MYRTVAEMRIMTNTEARSMLTTSLTQQNIQQVQHHKAKQAVSLLWSLLYLCPHFLPVFLSSYRRHTVNGLLVCDVPL